jgi:hypothetical protein
MQLAKVPAFAPPGSICILTLTGIFSEFDSNQNDSQGNSLRSKGCETSTAMQDAEPPNHLGYIIDEEEYVDWLPILNI